MYCRNCGVELDSDARFCKMCGMEVCSDSCDPGVDRKNQTVNASMFMNKKSEALALVLSLLIPGLGHMYIGDVKKGVILLVASVACAALGLYLLFPYIVCFALWIYAMYDSYVEAKKYNEYLLEHDGEKPW